MKRRKRAGKTTLVRGGSPYPPRTKCRACDSAAGTETRRAQSGSRLPGLLMAAVLTLLLAGCEGPQPKVDMKGWIKDLVFPPSTSEQVIAVQSPQADRRREALQTIVEDKKARQVPSVVKLYCLVARTDTDPMVRSAAVGGLAVLEGEEVVPTLCNVLETDKDPYVRADAAAALARHDDPAALEALIDAVASDGNTDVRIAAAEGLRQFRDKRAAAALAKAVAYDDVAVARNAWLGLRYMTGQDLPRQTEAWDQFLASAEDPFADYGDPPPVPKGESQRPHFTRGITDFVRSLFEKDPLEKELE